MFMKNENPEIQIKKEGFEGMNVELRYVSVNQHFKSYSGKVSKR